MEPKEKYSAIVFLDSEFRVNAPFLRAEEQTRIQIYSLLRFLEKNGILYVDLAPNHPLIQSLLKRNPLNDMERELKEREHLGLPPIWNLTRISNGSIFQIAESLRELLSRARLQFVNSDKSLLVRTKELDTAILMKELILAQKFLSLKQLNLLKIEREPLDI
jgi:primosomal protein N'